MELFKLQLEHPTNKDLVITFKALNEELNYHDGGHFELESDIVFIDSQLNKGIEAAWFMAEVTVKLKGTEIEVSSYLGGCSYATFMEFVTENDYFLDMVNEATNQLNDNLKDIYKALEQYVSKNGLL